MGVTYRHAVASDVTKIASICYSYFPELDVGMPGSTLDDFAVVEHLYAKIGPAKPPMILAVIDDKIVGMYGLEIDRYWWMKEYHISDYLWYVSPEHRDKNLGRGLISQAEGWAKERGLPFRPMVINQDRLAAKDRVFRMAGFSRVGSVYAKV